VVFDKQGNLYGTTSVGGAFNSGTVFMISSYGTETVLYSFTGGADGAVPYDGLIFDRHGNLYGTTAGGGAFGQGTVFKMPSSGGETVLYSFTGGADGGGPLAGVVLGPHGDLYGTTYGGGLACLGVSGGCGVVFAVTPSGSETVLHEFVENEVDGFSPYSGVVLDHGGNLYGTTKLGGEADRGTIFEAYQSGGETVLFGFVVSELGYTPTGNLVLDKSGNVYGTALYSEPGCGVIFEMSPPDGYQVLYIFGFNRPGDGCNPYAGVIFGAKGSLYGTTTYGGISNKGAVYELIP
jgi:uncharacterized repeat protein (TIGR03803 family)